MTRIIFILQEDAEKLPQLLHPERVDIKPTNLGSQVSCLAYMLTSKLNGCGSNAEFLNIQIIV